MTSSETDTPLSRRLALAGFGAGGLGLAMATRGSRVGAQATSTIDRATHPIVGIWCVDAPTGPTVAVFSANGDVMIGVPATQSGPNGVTFVSSEIGMWEPVSERGVRFTSVQLHSDMTGAFTGTVTIEGYPVVSEDGMSVVDDGPDTTVTIRDATHALVEVHRGAPAAIGARMRSGRPGFAAPEDGPTPRPGVGPLPY